MSDTPYIVGEVLTTFFENPQNFYKVILVRVVESNCVDVDDEIVVTGIFGQIHSDISYRFNGKIVSHPKYGEQFQADNYQQTQPTGKRGLIQYFSSTHFPGIGEKTAEKIVEKLGEDALERILNDGNALDGITGLTKKKKEMIREVITQNQGTEKLMFELTNLGFTPSIAQKIIGMFKDKAKQILDEDPYLLLQKIEGLGFRRMDSIAQSMGIDPDDASRLKGALFIVTRDFCYQTGDTYISSEVLITQAQRLLESCQNYLIDPEKLVDALNDLIREGVVYSDESRIAIASLYYAELGIRNAISRRVTNEKDTLSKESISKSIQRTQEKFDIIYDESQKEAIHQIMNEPIFVLTGGPGTGKTTIINAVIDVYCQLNEIQDVEDALVLAAPTGRAAKRMNELTGFPSSTIHRLLGIAIDSPEENFEDKEINGEFLIIDEMSMVDTWLMNRVLKAAPDRLKILLVGDSNQLPSVGPGQVLTDLLETKSIPSMELKRIHRQTNQSSIVELAHCIKDGFLPNNFAQKQLDRSFLPCTPERLVSIIEQVVVAALKKGYTKKDIQVLAPMYKGDSGINAINQMMQEILNPKIGNSVREVESFDRVFRVGDKVLQLVNLPEENVYNGDIGEITAIQFAKENEDQVDKIYVLFDQTEVEYTRTDWQQLTLAYCCSIHKAQGSEFKMVILPMVNQYSRMLQRNLLYTAVTRSQQYLILCGEAGAFQKSATTISPKRATFLQEFLRDLSISTFEEFEEKIIEDTSDSHSFIEEDSNIKENNMLTLRMIEQEMISPMIGMEDLSPYDFMRRS
ncbi:ATP-dependent RecD-like DNA helicase [uncultured Granulicatella sp.]|uniref:SF1B family DNA helicase RecD2 n=1 Tax=uncultured Granulicatella sp. TaxID=316089 RepID=UPI002596E764|nr:ATP-dependent RecD-like DNA helicase [uncultured Granulicatella sp.]